MKRSEGVVSPGCSGRANPIGAESPLPADQVTTAALGGCNGRAAPIGAESPLPADQVTTAALCLK